MELKKTSLEAINQFNDNTLIRHLGIEITEIGTDYLTARMPVDQAERAFSVETSS